MRRAASFLDVEITMTVDSLLQQAVLAELNWEPSVASAHIGVTANAGVITLTGHVDSYSQKHAAETAALRVRNVRAVAEELEVRLPVNITRGDDEIAAAAIERLAWDSAIPKDTIKVTVAAGWLTLTGEAEWNFQRSAAEDDVRRLFGVVAVSNDITIKPNAAASNISDNIMHALHRSWFFDPSTIDVRDEDGTVRLTGTVHSQHDRRIAAETAWAAAGTIAVENDIVVV
jgi:osmotically-inducible protein OsmY